MTRGSFDANVATVRDRIRQRRLALGLSQRELASAGVTYAYISRLEANARTPSAKALRKLAPKLGVPVHWLETGEHDPAEQLAQLVFDHQHRPLPRRAVTLARAVLRQHLAERLRIDALAPQLHDEAQLAFPQQRTDRAHDPSVAADRDPLADLERLLAAQIRDRAPPQRGAVRSGTQASTLTPSRTPKPGE
jgi:transcriptional regulator with XRE-family HTH domain